MLPQGETKLNKPLYKLTEDFRIIETLLDNEDFRPGDIQSMLSNIKAEIEDKVENIAKLVLSCKADIEAIKYEEQRLTARRQALNNKVEFFKNYLLNEMTAMGIDKIKREVLTVSIRTNPPSIEVVDENKIPEEYRHWTWALEKKLMIDHFKQTGEILSGINVITDKKSVVIR